MNKAAETGDTSAFETSPSYRVYKPLADSIDDDLVLEEESQESSSDSDPEGCSRNKNPGRNASSIHLRS